MPHDEDKGSFIRWQATTIAQLTYTLNLILGFSVATLGFQVLLLLDKKVTLGCCQKTALYLSILLLLLSTASGIGCVIVRLIDFRLTEQVARLREKPKPDAEVQLIRASIEKLRACIGKLDKGTWYLFWCQIGTFGLGILLTVLAVAA